MVSYSDIQAQFNSYSLQCFLVGKAGWPKDILGKTELSRANSLIPCIPASNPLSVSEATRSSNRWIIGSLPLLPLGTAWREDPSFLTGAEDGGAGRESTAARLCNCRNSPLGLTEQFSQPLSIPEIPWLSPPLRKSHKIFTVAELQDAVFLKGKVKC